MNQVVIENLHGAAARVEPTATAYPHRQPGYNVVLVGQWLDPAEDDANIAWVRDTYETLRPYLSDSAYVNYLDADDAARVQAAYGPNQQRLLALEERYDPTNLFRLNVNLAPPATGAPETSGDVGWAPERGRCEVTAVSADRWDASTRRRKESKGRTESKSSKGGAG